MAAKLLLLRGSTVEKDADDSYEPTPVSELPPNAWQEEVDSLIALEREIDEEAQADRATEAEAEERKKD